MNCNSENASKRLTFLQIWQNLSEGVKIARHRTPTYRTVKLPCNKWKKAKSTILYEKYNAVGHKKKKKWDCFEVFHSVHSHIFKHLTPTKYTIFIHYIHLLCFSYMFWYYIHHQGEPIWLLLKNISCYAAIIYGYCISYIINIKIQLFIYWSYNTIQQLKSYMLHYCTMS